MTRHLRARRASFAGSTGAGDTGHLRRYYDRTATDYDRWLRIYERVMRFGDLRARLLSQARGATLEVGIGTGVNMRHYPRGVQLTGVDLSAGMLELAARRAARLGRSVDLRSGDAQRLDLPDAAFDTVVATLVLSSVPDHCRAIAEIARVLNPGGRLLLLDQVRSPLALVRRLQTLVEPVLVDYAGWRITRDLPESLRAAGFVVEECRRSRLGMLVEVVAGR